MRIRIDLAYDGTDFKGWAKQPGLRTVQGDLEAALATVLRLPSGVGDLRRPHRHRRPRARPGRAPRRRRGGCSRPAGRTGTAAVDALAAPAQRHPATATYAYAG